MGGRSVMDMWFRYWNLPGVLNKISVYKKWPIPYKKYQLKEFYFEYIPVCAPHQGFDKPNYEYGKAMFESLSEGIGHRKFNALLFKFCFVDFGVKSIENIEGKVESLILLVKKAYEYTQRNKMDLLLCNSLPVMNPGPYDQEVRYRFNKWVDEFQKEKQDVVKIDLFGILTDEKGKLKKEFSVEPEESDSHPNMNAFKILTEHLLQRINKKTGGNGYAAI